MIHFEFASSLSSFKMPKIVPTNLRKLRLRSSFMTTGLSLATMELLSKWKIYGLSLVSTHQRMNKTSHMLMSPECTELGLWVLWLLVWWLELEVGYKVIMIVLMRRIINQWKHRNQKYIKDSKLNLIEDIVIEIMSLFKN